MKFKVYFWNCCSGLLRKIDFVTDLIVSNNLDVFFIAESEVRSDFNLGCLSIDGYDLVCAKTLHSKNKSRIICYKKPEIKVLDIENDCDDMIGIGFDDAIVMGLYRGFKCSPGETKGSNFRRMLETLNKLDKNKKVYIIGDFNID